MPVGTLSQVQIDSFHDRGFLVVPDLLYSDEVSRIAAAARGEFETHRYMDAKARFPAPTKYILSEDSLRLADIRLVVDHPRIVTAVSELLADEVCLSAFVIYSMPPGTEGTGGDYQRTHESAHCDYKAFLGARAAGHCLRGGAGGHRGRTAARAQHARGGGRSPAARGHARLHPRQEHIVPAPCPRLRAVSARSGADAALHHQSAPSRSFLPDLPTGGGVPVHEVAVVGNHYHGALSARRALNGGEGQ